MPDRAGPAAAPSGILTVTLNPALDVTTSVERLTPDAKLRCEAPRLDPGGGGANISRALLRLGRESTPFIAIGGGFGHAYRELLEAEGLRPVWFETGGQTRESLAVHDRAGGRQYRFVMPGAPWAAETGDAALARLEELMAEGLWVALSGSQPPGLGEDFIPRLAQAAGRAGARLALDTSGGALEAAARGGRPLELLRMDRHEAAGLLEIEAEALDEGRAAGLARDLVARGAARTAVVTIGGAGAVGATAEETWRATPPKVEVLSTTGAGDSFLAALLLGLSEGRGLRDSLALAMGAAASAVTTPATELCDPQATRDHAARMEMTRL